MNLLEKHFDTALDTPDGIKKLRELILTLAMKGKLVSQDPNDQPASELLKEIVKEKKRLFESGVIRKPEIVTQIEKENIPFPIPKNWIWVPLGDVGETNIGLTYSPTDISQVGTPVLRSNNIKDGKLVLTDLVRVNIPIKRGVIVKEGDLLICARNGSKALVGKTARITGLQEEMAFGAFMAIFRSRINNYLFYFINSPLFRKMIDEVNTMTINQITQGNLKSTIFPLPPLAEQKRIVDKIDELMALCDQLEAQKSERNQKRLTVHSVALNKLLSAPDQTSFDSSWQFITRHFNELYSVKENVAELRKAVLQLAVMGKLVPQDPNDQPASELLKEIEAEKKRLVKEGKIKNQEPLPLIKPEEIPYSLPKSWEWVRLGGIVKHDRDVTYGIVLMGGEPKRGGIKVLRCSDVKFRKLDIQSVRGVEEAISSQYARTIIKGGEILMNIRGTLGGCAIATTEVIGFNIAREIALIVINDSIFNRYILDVLTSQITQSAIQSNLRGIAYKGLNLNLLRNFLIPLPPLAEQKRIVEKVDQLMALCDQLENQIGKASQKQSELLGAVLAGV